MIEYMWIDLALRGHSVFPESVMLSKGAKFVQSLSSSTVSNHGDSPHGDSPHGDSHGDHTDAPAKLRETEGIEATWIEQTD